MHTYTIGLTTTGLHALTCPSEPMLREYYLGATSKSWFIDQWLEFQINSDIRDILPNGFVRLPYTNIKETTAAIQFEWEAENPIPGSTINEDLVGKRFRLFKQNNRRIILTKRNGYWLKCDTCGVLRHLQSKENMNTAKYQWLHQVCLKVP